MEPISVSRRRLSPLAAISGTTASAAAMPYGSLTGLMVNLPSPREVYPERWPPTRRGGPRSLHRGATPWVRPERSNDGLGVACATYKEDQAKEDEA
jgi:hypothetical protein